MENPTSVGAGGQSYGERTSHKTHKNDPIGRGVKTKDRPIDELLCLHTIDISVEIEKSAKSVESPSSWDSGRLVSSIEQDEKYWSSIC